MTEFDEQKLIAKGVCEKQANIAKLVAEIAGISFEEAIVTMPDFVYYKFKQDGTPYKTESIDLRLPAPKNGKIVTNQEITPMYLKAKFKTDFKEQNCAQYFLNCILLPMFEDTPFAAGVITKTNHNHSYIEHLTNQDEKIKPKRKYLFGKIPPHIALFFSIQAIGDTTIEIYDTQKTN